MGPRELAVGLAGGRIAIGVVSLLAPEIVGRAMMGPEGDSGGTRLFLRVVGARHHLRPTVFPAAAGAATAGALLSGWLAGQLDA
jgi:hypothetical protein